jgi:exonuclease III
LGENSQVKKKNNKKEKKSESIKIIQLNIKSLKQNKEELVNFLSEEKKDVGLLQETNLNKNDEIEINKYKLVRKDRNKTKGGGVGLIINKKLNYEIIKVKEVTPIEIIGIKTKINDTTYNIFSIYIPPSSQKITCKVMQSKLEKILNELKNYENVILGGDFNSHHTSWGSEKIDSFGKITSDLTTLSELTNLNEMFLENNRDKFTYMNPPQQKRSVIDLTFVSTRIINKIKSFEITNENCNSDHMMLKITLNEKNKEVNMKREKLDISKYKTEIDELKVEELTDLENFETKHDEIIKKNKKLTNTNLNAKNYPKNFWSKELSDMKKTKRELFKKFNEKRNKKTATIYDLLEIKKIQAIMKKKVRQNKRKNFTKFINKLHPKNSLKTIYDNYNKLRNRGKFTQQNMIENSKEKANQYLRENFKTTTIKKVQNMKNEKENYYNSDFKDEELDEIMRQ